MTATAGTIGGKRVLIAEDEYFIAKGLVRDLRAMGVEVVGPAPSIADAAGLIGSEPLDGAILDINLRGEAAFSLADTLLERGIPFVFVTGYAAEALPERYAGVPHCEKPADARALAAALFPAKA